jgi:anti-anti-sigma factor
MNEDEFGVETALEDQQATVTLRGEVDLSAKPRVLDVLASIADAGAKSVVFDLAAVSFLDSSGLGAMLHARHLGLALTLRNPTPRVERLLELVVLGELVEIQRTA